jgi:hypothetical protein
MRAEGFRVDAQTHTLVVYVASFLSVSLVALVHLRVHRLRFLADTSVPWIAASAGVAVSYVFVNLLPKLATGHAVLATVQPNRWLGYVVSHSYVLALVGFITFYAAHLARKRLAQLPAERIGFREAPTAVKVMALAFPVYNFLIGDLIGVYAMQRGAPAILFGVVMAIHFIGLDHLARTAFTRLYDETLQGLCILALFAGWFTALAMPVQPEVLALDSSFLAGGIILVTTVSELPHVQTRRDFGAFSAGAVIVAGLLLILEASGH